MAGAVTVPVSSGGSIADAVRSATAGDTIEVGTGAYSESLVLDKTITIQAGDGAKVVITGVGASPVVTINAGANAILTRLILRRAGTGVLINGGTAALQNLVIVGSVSTGTAIECGQSAGLSVTISHVTIHRGERGVVCAAQTLSITDTILSQVTLQGMNLGPTSTLSGSHLFYQTPPPPLGSYVRRETGLEFVNDTESDFHLTAASTNAIDQGSGGDDLGAYGGSNASTKPFPPSGVTVRCTPSVPDSCTVSWVANTDHLITGYRRAHTAPLASSPPISSDLPSSVCSAGSCSSSVSSLPGLTAGDAPGTPAAPRLKFRDARLDASWDPVPQATFYQVLAGTASGSLTVVPGADHVTATEKTISDLLNGTPYYVAVGAGTEPTLTATVASLYGSLTATPTAGEGSGSDPKTVPYGAAILGLVSPESVETPESVVGFPPLAETGGCFIATAAYGSPLAPQVSVLRAWRDRYLQSNPPGRVIVRTYETVSPPIADVLRRVDPLRAMVRWTLAPVIGAAWLSMEWPWLSLACVMGVVVALAAVGRSRRGRRRG